MTTTSILRSICIVVAVLVVAVAGISITVANPRGPTVVEVVAPTTSSTTTSSTTSSTSTSTSTSSSTSTTAPGAGALRRGDEGADVAGLQRRLHALGYWVGARNDAFGLLTEQAVTAFQKVEGLAPDGVAGPATLAALDAAKRPKTSARGNLMEVDKARQVLFVVRDGAVAWTLNVSTGTEKPYRVNGRTEMADTPPGHWTVDWVVNGTDVGELGALYRPRYFHEDGIAVHGYHSVPPYPASHGCVRVTEAAMDWLWAENLMPLGSAVWVH
ncbi:MAG TPA: L,D-transpeptidase family protein [Acidimicrobiales bacterium]|nr:L,D-transpeptidase family protein [Acidimicrobiales bacterium]